MAILIFNNYFKYFLRSLQIHQDLLSTTRDIFKHNLRFEVPVYAPPSAQIDHYFQDSEAKSWIRGYNIHTIRSAHV